MSDIPSEPGDRDAGHTGPVSEAEWEAFQREAEESVRRPSKAGRGPKEPSARARMVAARFRAQDEAAGQAAKRGRFGRKRTTRQPEPWQPEGWRTGPAWREMQGGRAGRWRQTRRVGAAFAVLAMLAGGLWFADHRGYVDLNPGGSGGSDAAPLTAETARPTGAPPGGAFADPPTLAEPFAGSPARRWAEGAEAIEPPRAKPVGDVPAERVAEALELTRRYLVAANLDRDVLRGGYPEKALDLVDPLAEEYLAGLTKALEDPSGDGPYDPIVSFTRFDPDDARLAGDVVKVRGRMTVKEGEQGRAVIEADYSFVYPVRPAGDGEAVTRVVVRRGLTVDVAPAQGWAGTPGKLWISTHAGEVAGADCESPDGLLHPSFPTDRDRDRPDGPAFDPYDRSQDLRTETGAGDCGVAERV